MAKAVNRTIPYTKPSITELEVHYATDEADNGWGEHRYDYIIRLEEARKGHQGVEYAIASNSCPGALHLGMHALGIATAAPNRAPRPQTGVCGHPARQLVPGP
jgi:perosamine synthetase